MYTDLFGDVVEQDDVQSAAKSNWEALDKLKIEPLNPVQQGDLAEAIAKALISDLELFSKRYVEERRAPVRGKAKVQTFEGFEAFHYPYGAETIENIFWVFDLHDDPCDAPFLECCVDADRDGELFRRLMATAFKEEIKASVLYINAHYGRREATKLVEKLDDYINLWHMI